MDKMILNDGNQIPVVGFGVFMIPNNGPTYDAVLQALKAGYRHIDTAAGYMNESDVGKAIKDSGIDRQDIFITSKLWVQDMKNYDAARYGIEASLKKSGLEYIDLYLLHQAMGDYFSAWRAMEDAYKEGKLKAIGVSNFYPHVLTNFCETVKIKPMVNQVELHPYFTQEQALETMKQYDVIPEAWAPLGGGRYNPFEDEMLLEIAKKYLDRGSELGMFLNAKRYREKNVTLAKESGLSFLRVGADAGDADIAVQAVKTATPVS